MNMTNQTNYTIIKAANSEEMGKIAASIVIKQVQQKPNSVLGLATGSTPLGMYKELIEDYQNNATNYDQIRTINLDEYVGIERQDRNSYYTFMVENLFKHINIDLENTHVPNGKPENLVAECQRYEEIITELGGIDLQVLGIGQNGHIGFNEPGTPFNSKTHSVLLDESTRQANARFFSSLEDVPTHAITMGISTILKSKKILLMASGENKAEALRQLVQGDVTEQMPASALSSHTNVTIIADQAALSLLD